MVQVTFVAYQSTLQTEQLLVVGSSVELGEWEPARAVPLAKGSDGVTHKCVVVIHAERDLRLEYKYLLIDSSIPGHVKWENGDNRAVLLVDGRHGETTDNSFERGGNGWTPYEATQHFLVVEDSEEDVGLSTDEEERPQELLGVSMPWTNIYGGERRRLKRSAAEQSRSKLEQNGLAGKASSRMGAGSDRNADGKEKPFWMFWKDDTTEQQSKPGKKNLVEQWRADDGNTARSQSLEEHQTESEEKMEEGSKVPLMNVSPGHGKVIVRRASEVNLQDGHELYRTRALPLWVLWRQERNGDASAKGSRSPLAGNSTANSPSAQEKAQKEDEEKEAHVSKASRNPFWLLS